MSPEQIRGEAVDGRADIYAIGCILYECATGQSVFPRAKISEELSNHLFKIPDYSAINQSAPNLAPAIQTCLEKNRAKRFSDAKALRVSLSETRHV